MTAPVEQPVRPVAGPTFRAVAERNYGGRKRLKMIALIAAYIDAGHDAPTVADLADRTKFKYAAVVALVNRLEQDGHLVVHRAGRKRVPARYEIPLPGSGVVR